MRQPDDPGAIYYRNKREKLAHHLTGIVCGQCRCSMNLGWRRGDMQPHCECWKEAGEIMAMLGVLEDGNDHS